MWRVQLFATLAVLLLVAQQKAGASVVLVHFTGFGDITIELYDANAPQTVANFLQYVKDGFYDGTIIDRVAPGFIIQGGGYLPGLIAQQPVRPPIPNEFGHSNVRGTVAMGKLAGDPNSATSRFFINLADNASLDTQNGGFTVFGNVLSGMEVVDAIAAVQTECTLDPNQTQFCGVPVQPIIVQQIVPVAIAQVSGGGTICEGDSATVTVTMQGGSPPYHITLSNGGGTQNGASPLQFGVSPSSTTTYTASGTDADGHDALGSGSATVTVVRPPTVGASQILCGNNGTTAALGASTPTVGAGNWSLVSGGTGTFSNASDPNATFTHTDGTGPIVLRWTITNPPCPESTADVTITIAQLAITCPPDITVTTDADSCEATNVNIGTATTTTGCPLATNDHPATTYPSGTTTVTWTATNPTGDSVVCTQTVTVNDTEKPVINCPADVTVSTDPGSCQATNVATGTATATDNCSVVAESNDHPAMTYLKGTTTVAWTAIDGVGGTATCVQSVTVNDTEKPFIICPADVTVSTDPGSCQATNVAIGTATATDNCTVVAESNDHPAMTYLKGTTTVAWTAIDAAGSTATCLQTVTVDDTEKPVITCPADVTVSTDPGSGEATNVDIGTPTTPDNCQAVMVSSDHLSTTYPAGTTTISWTVTDAAGNTATCAQTLTVTRVHHCHFFGHLCGLGLVESAMCSLIGLTAMRSAGAAVRYTTNTTENVLATIDAKSSRAHRRGPGGHHWWSRSDALR